MVRAIRARVDHGALVVRVPAPAGTRG
jgi:hypothetical protein